MQGEAAVAMAANRCTAFLRKNAAEQKRLKTALGAWNPLRAITEFGSYTQFLGVRNCGQVGNRCESAIYDTSPYAGRKRRLALNGVAEAKEC
jgi:hypothetical protein